MTPRFAIARIVAIFVLILPAGGAAYAQWSSAPTEARPRVFVGGTYAWSLGDHAPERVIAGQQQSITGWIVEAGVRVTSRISVAGELLPYSVVNGTYEHKFITVDQRESEWTLGAVGHVTILRRRDAVLEGVVGFSIVHIQQRQVFTDMSAPAPYNLPSEKSTDSNGIGFLYGADVVVPVVRHVAVVPRVRFHTLPLHNSYTTFSPASSVTYIYVGVGGRFDF